jgi:hypothetical protein
MGHFASKQKKTVKIIEDSKSESFMNPSRSMSSATTHKFIVKVNIEISLEVDMTQTNNIDHLPINKQIENILNTYDDLLKNVYTDELSNLAKYNANMCLTSSCSQYYDKPWNMILSGTSIKVNKVSATTLL